MTNHVHQKYIKSAKLRDKWGYFDAQPPHVKEWLSQFPIDLWPGSRQSIAPVLADTERTYLLGLESVWGPDHPAVQDARLRVVAKRGRAIAVLDIDSLDELF